MAFPDVQGTELPEQAKAFIAQRIVDAGKCLAAEACQPTVVTCASIIEASLWMMAKQAPDQFRGSSLAPQTGSGKDAPRPKRLKDWSVSELAIVAKDIGALDGVAADTAMEAWRRRSKSVHLPRDDGRLPEPFSLRDAEEAVATAEEVLCSAIRFLSERQEHEPSALEGLIVPLDNHLFPDVDAAIAFAQQRRYTTRHDTDGEGAVTNAVAWRVGSAPHIDYDLVPDQSGGFRWEPVADGRRED